MTRKEPLSTKLQEIGGIKAYLVSGTPGDCAALSIHNLYSKRPDIVLSGPNLGINSGLPYSISSGTLGGALVASISGTPSIALSCELSQEVWALMDARAKGEAFAEWKSDFERLGELAGVLAKRLIEINLPIAGRVVSVNTPWQAKKTTPLKPTRVRPGVYGPLFGKNPDGTYSLRPKEILFDDTPERILSDDICLRNGEISVTVLDQTLASLALSESEMVELSGKLATSPAS
jgi:5'/3'-nucleotidase SurE